MLCCAHPDPYIPSTWSFIELGLWAHAAAGQQPYAEESLCMVATRHTQAVRHAAVPAHLRVRGVSERRLLTARTPWSVNANVTPGTLFISTDATAGNRSTSMPMASSVVSRLSTSHVTSASCTAFHQRTPAAATPWRRPERTQSLPVQPPAAAPAPSPAAHPAAPPTRPPSPSPAAASSQHRG
jgi:hypothetical protein